MSFTDLEEFSSYRVTVTAIYTVFNSITTESSSEEFSTPSSRMYVSYGHFANMSMEFFEGKLYTNA